MTREQIAAVVLQIAGDVLEHPDSKALRAFDVADAIASRVADKLAAPAPTWELVHDVAFERVRRMRVPLGWLYQAEIDQRHEPLHQGAVDTCIIGWHQPIFVPDLHDEPNVAPVDATKLDEIATRLDSLRGDMASVGGNRLVEIVGDLVALLGAVRP